jgi:hypothetical protein
MLYYQPTVLASFSASGKPQPALYLYLCPIFSLIWGRNQAFGQFHSKNEAAGPEIMV